jgi:hypothetical protein
LPSLIGTIGPGLLRAYRTLRPGGSW